MPKVTITEPPPKPATSAAIRKPKPTLPTKTPQQIREEKLKTATGIYIFRLDASGNRNFLATYPFPLADGIIIEGLIQQLHGAGQYRVEYRNAKGQIVTTDEPLGIEALANVHAPAQTAHSAPMPTHMGLPLTPQYIEAIVKSALQQARQPESALDQFAQTAKILKDLSAITPPPPPPPPPQKSLLEQVKDAQEVIALFTPKTEPKPAPVVSDWRIELAKLVIANPEAAETLDVAGLRPLLASENPAEKETNVWDVLKGLGEQLLPVVAPMVMNWMAQRQAANPNDATAQAVPMPPTAHPNLPPAQTPPAQPAPQPVAPYQQMLMRILQAMEQGIRADFIAEEIEQAAQHDATLAPLMDSLLNVEPSQLLQGLAQLSPQAARVCQLPHALQWLTDLQSEFPAEDEEPTTEGAAEASGAAQPPTGAQGIPRQGARPKNAKAGV